MILCTEVMAEVMGSAVADCSGVMLLLDGAARQVNDVKGEMCGAEETSQRLLLTFINPQNIPYLAIREACAFTSSRRTLYFIPYLAENGDSVLAATAESAILLRALTLQLEDVDSYLPPHTNELLTDFSPRLCFTTGCYI